MSFVQSNKPDFHSLILLIGSEIFRVRKLEKYRFLHLINEVIVSGCHLPEQVAAKESINFA